jgi:ATP-dependent helicase/nuclease subunit A
MNNNELQLLASDPGYSIYVSASAGSGKTKVLIDRILRLLLNGTHIANILCVTFTKVAANEILDRLKNYTKRWKLFDDVMLQEELAYLTGCEPDHNTLMRAKSLYKEILKEYARIKIQTMHAFCANVLNIQVDKNKENYLYCRAGRFFKTSI